MYYLIFIILLILILILISNKSSFSDTLSYYENIKQEKLNKVFKSKILTPQTQNIPKVINKIYIDNTMGLSKMDPIIYKLLDKTMSQNPGYTYKIWSGDDCRKYIKDNFSKDHLDCFDNLKPYAFKADFARYCIIYNEGGFYSDLKEDTLVPFNNNYSFIGVVDLGNKYCLSNFCLQNAFFAAIPKHPLLKNCIESVILNCKNKYYGNNYLEPTGPRLFGKELEQLKQLPDNNLFGYYIHNNDGGYHVFNGSKAIIHKCQLCQKGNDWKYGNNWIKMWNERSIY
jgi:mannosyltransferase OCH1-like enzyme